MIKKKKITCATALGRCVSSHSSDVFFPYVMLMPKSTKQTFFLKNQLLVNQEKSMSKVFFLSIIVIGNLFFVNHKVFSSANFLLVKKAN